MSMINQGANDGDRRTSAEKGSTIDKRLGKKKGTKAQKGSQDYGNQVYSQKRGGNAARQPGTVSPHKKSITGK